MKKWILPTLAAGALGLLFAFGGTMHGYRTLRAVSATDDTGYAADAATYSDVSGDIVWLPKDQLGQIQIIMKGTNAADEELNWCLYAVKSTSCAPQYVAHGTALLGATETGETDEYWCDTIVITNQNWPGGTVAVEDGYQYNLGTGAVAGAGIAVLKFDSAEFPGYIMLMSKSTCATMGAEITNFY